MSARTRANLSLFSVAALSLVAGGALALQLQPATSVQAGSAPAVQAPAAPPLTPDTFRGVARRETDGVVNISTTKVVKHSVMDDPFRYFFGDARNPFSRPEGRGEGPEKETQRSLGSGFIVDKEGYVLTNRHVVDGADAIRVTLANGKKYEAKLVGKDARTDVALLKIEPREPLTAIELGDSDHLDVGEWVMAIGNPFGLGGNSVTVGVVSYKGRPLDLSTRGTPVEMI
ncbi:MAG TPA: trypsin-like peptidase domain-containing protein, partial [Vicinamibacteria bacterium]